MYGQFISLLFELMWITSFRMRNVFAIVLPSLLGLGGFFAFPLEAAHPERLQPFLETYCLECHGPDEDKADLDFTLTETLDRLATDHELLETLEWVLVDKEMPPEDEAQPTDEEREEALAILDERLVALENSAPNDPGLVLMPRLNQAEYNNVIRDLTGHDLQPARFFPADQVAETGFANMGAVLNVGSLHAQNYLSSAKWVLEHALVSPGRGIVWYPERIETSDAEKLRESLLKKWYIWLAKKEAEVFEQNPTDGADFDVLNVAEYLLTAWRYHHRESLDRPEATFADFAAEADGLVAPVVLERWYRLLTRDDLTPLVGRLSEEWKSQPAPGEADLAEVRALFEEWEALLYSNLSERYDDRWFNSRVRFDHQPDWEISKANEPFGNRLRRYQKNGFPKWAENLMEKARYEFTLDLAEYGKSTLYLLVTSSGDGDAGDRVRLTERVLGEDDSWEKAGIEMEVLEGNAESTDDGDWIIDAPAVVALRLPEKADGKLKGSFQLSYENKEKASVQTLFLDEKPQRHEKRFFPGRQVLAWPERRGGMREMVGDFVSLISRSSKFSGSELSAALADVPDVPEGMMDRLGGLTEGGSSPDAPYFLDLEDLTSTLSGDDLAYHEALLADLHAFAEVPQRQLAEAYRKSDIEVKGGTDLLVPEKRKRLEGHDELFDEVAGIEAEHREQARDILAGFLREVWRRPVTEAEVGRYLALYDKIRAEGRNFDAAVKRPLTVAMIVPDFLFKLRRAGSDEVAPLSQAELASRLSFFLWASMPDERLLRLAEEEKLNDPEVLRSEVDRMLRDERGRALGIEFAGRWLGFHGFDDFSQPDMDTFPEYTEELRGAMYEEAIRFFRHLFAENRPIRDLVEADYTFLNETLAEHYGIDGVEGAEMRKVSLEGEIHEQRGGIFGFGSLLTVNSTPLRANPIYRGVWVIDKVLGTPTHEPPPVPPLSEAAPPGEDLKFHELLELHRADAACAVCHDRIDPPGLALEHFNAVGAWKAEDENGDPVFARGELKDGRIVEGLAGIRTVVGESEDDLIDQFCRKLAIFGLGRELVVTDRPLLKDMATALKSDGGRVRAALDALVTSPQFLEKRTYHTLPEVLVSAHESSSTNENP